MTLEKKLPLKNRAVMELLKAEKERGIRIPMVPVIDICEKVNPIYAMRYVMDYTRFDEIYKEVEVCDKNEQNKIGKYKDD